MLLFSNDVDESPTGISNLPLQIRLFSDYPILSRIRVREIPGDQEVQVPVWMFVCLFVCLCLCVCVCVCVCACVCACVFIV